MPLEEPAAHPQLSADLRQNTRGAGFRAAACDVVVNSPRWRVQTLNSDAYRGSIAAPDIVTLMQKEEQQPGPKLSQMAARSSQTCRPALIDVRL